jgi:peptidyl-tRNA hydrolase, PTH1 family
MKLIVGLGNPEPKYKLNRHNIGFILADAYARSRNFKNGLVRTSNKPIAIQCGIVAKQPVVILKPQDWMNSSGVSVKLIEMVLKQKNEDVLVIHDDLSFDFGDFKLKPNGSSGGHNGVQSIINTIGKDFNRFRVGIGSPEEGQTPYDYVLSDFTLSEQKWFCELCSLTISIVDSFIEHGAQKTMNTFNSRR